MSNLFQIHVKSISNLFQNQKYISISNLSQSISKSISKSKIHFYFKSMSNLFQNQKYISISNLSQSISKSKIYFYFKSISIYFKIYFKLKSNSNLKNTFLFQKYISCQIYFKIKTHFYFKLMSDLFQILFTYLL